MELQEYEGVNIIGWNSPEWATSYFGSIFARNIPVGIYSTNSQASCEYIADHSQAKIIIAENKQKAGRYKALLKAGKLKKIVLYAEEVGEHDFGVNLISWK